MNFFRPQVFDLGFPFVPLLAELLIVLVGVILADDEAVLLPPFTVDCAFL